MIKRYFFAVLLLALLGLNASLLSADMTEMDANPMPAPSSGPVGGAHPFATGGGGAFQGNGNQPGAFDQNSDWQEGQGAGQSSHFTSSMIDEGDAPSADQVRSMVDQTVAPLWDFGATFEKGVQGLGFTILTTLFGTDVIAAAMLEPSGTFSRENEDGTVDKFRIEGGSQGISVAMMSFAAQLAFALLPVYISMLSLTGFLNTLQFGEVFGQDQPRTFFWARWGSGILLAVPNPGFFGMAGIQQILIILAVYSNGIGNHVNLMLVEGAYESAGGASGVVQALNLAQMPEPNPDITSSALDAFVQTSVQSACATNARQLGMSARERREMCNYIGSAPSHQDGEMKGSAEDSERSSAGASPDEYCSARYKQTQGWQSRTNLQWAYCVLMQEALEDVRPRLNAIHEIDDPDERQEALAEALKDFYDKLGVVDRTTSKIVNQIVRRSRATSAGVCRELPPQEEERCRENPEEYDASFFSDPLVQQRIIAQVIGWPGVGMQYSRIATEIEAMNSVVHLESQDFTGSFQLSNVHKTARLARTQRQRLDSAYNQSVAADGLVDHSAAASQAQDDHLSPGARIARTLTGFFMPHAVNLGAVATEGAQLGNDAVTSFLVSQVTSGSAPEMMYNYSANLLGTFAALAVGSDVIGFISSRMPTSAATGAAGGSGSGSDGNPLKSWAGKLNSSFDESSSFVGTAFNFVIKMTLVFMTIIAFINVAVIPKLPAIYVAIMSIDWAINLLVIVFAAPLWLIFNLSTAPVGKHLMTQTVLKGIQILSWVLLYPVLVVFGVAVSLIIFNLAVPLAVTLMISSYQDGIMGGLINMVMAPFMTIFIATLMGFLAISLIVRVPYQFASFLGLSPMDGEMIKGAMRYLGGESHMGQAQSTMSVPYLNANPGGR